MTNLIQSKPEQEAFNSLPPEHKYLVNLRIETPFSELGEPNQKKLCLDVITRAMVSQSPNGQPDPKILQFQSIELFNELKGKFGNLTRSEINECFRVGIRGQYGEYFGLCAKRYHQFLKGWFENPERGKAFQAYLDKVNNYKVAEKPALEPEYFNKVCEKAYTEYLETGNLPIVPFSLYDQIKDYTGEDTLIDRFEWSDIKSEGNKLYKEKIKGNAIAKTWPLNLDNKVYNNSIKTVALKYYFERLKKEGKRSIK